MTESAPESASHQKLEAAEHSAGLVSKGLAAGKVGTFSGAILGISCVAPGYTLTASIGLIVAAVGLKMPAIFIAGFIPMFLTAYAYRELNSRAPDCGASFTWSTKAFGPYVGWMCGWGMVVASIIVLSNLAAIAVEFFYLFIARITNHPSIAELADNKEKLNELSARWQSERSAIDAVRDLKEELENLRGAADRAERDGDLGKAAELRYGRIPALEKDLAAALEN